MISDIISCGIHHLWRHSWNSKLTMDSMNYALIAVSTGVHLIKQKPRVARPNGFKVVLNCVSKIEPSLACGEWKPTDLYWCKAEDNETFTADPAVEASITLLSQRTQKYYWVEFGNQIRKQREELYPILFCVWTIWALLLFYGVSVWGSAGQESSWMNSILFLSLLLSKLKEVVGDNLHTLCSVPTRYAVTTLLLYTTVFFSILLKLKWVLLQS